MKTVRNYNSQKGKGSGIRGADSDDRGFPLLYVRPFQATGKNMGS
jgi:hypothetical protein